MVANPVETGTNSFDWLFPDAPNGTTVSLWDPATQTLSARSAFTTGLGWFPDLTLPPGQGALLYAPEPFTNTFSGKLLNPDGSPLDDYRPFPLPPPNLPTGTYLLSSKAPANLSSRTLPVFPLVLGRGPQESLRDTKRNSSDS
ncbi:MAG TPA: hypothetical protein VL361_25415 [Candidatus Limnocylindrales bacterium]|nr:hypothetical protein [Candidatus Limnocylindrales bacterium]